MEQNTVSVDLKEYQEFIISQYENGKIKTSLLDEIKILKNNLEELNEAYSNKLKITNEYKTPKDKIMELAFRINSMGSDSRSEQTNISDTYVSNYSGFHKLKVPLLVDMGITIEELVEYVNTQWDIKDAKDQAEKVAKELKEKEDADNKE